MWLSRSGYQAMLQLSSSIQGVKIKYKGFLHTIDGRTEAVLNKILHANIISTIEKSSYSCLKQGILI
jgi:hypothetical protein